MESMKQTTHELSKILLDLNLADCEQEQKALASVLDETSEYYYAQPNNILESIMECDSEFENAIARMLQEKDYAGIGMMIEINAVQYWKDFALCMIKKEKNNHG